MNNSIDSSANNTAATALWQRRIELPRFLRACEGRDELAATLDEVSAELKVASRCLVSGRAVSRELARALAQGDPVVEVEASTLAEVRRLASTTAVTQAGSVLAVGGGRVIDVAKYLCRELDLPLVCVPTQLTTDGICSPISVLGDDEGRISSLPARLPAALVADLEVVAAAPIETSRAGLGDVLANRTALWDWRLAVAAGRASHDDFAALLSEAAFEAVFETDVTALGKGVRDLGLIRRLLNALVLSGLAMEVAGSSRPCSGAEHLISHALDRIAPGTAYHGEQVAFAALLVAYLQDQDWQGLKSFMTSTGMTAAAQGFGLGAGRIVEVVQLAPSMRPDRYTVLDEADLSAESLSAAIAAVTTM